MLGNIVDIMILALIVICILRGFSRGFLKSGTSIISSICAFLGGVILSSPLAIYIYKLFNIRILLFESIMPKVNAMVLENGTAVNIAGEEVFSQIPVVGEFLNSYLGDSEKIKEIFASMIDVNKITNSIVNLIEPVILMVLTVITFLIVAIIVKLIIKIVLEVVFSIVLKIPLAKEVDSLLGALLGGVSGVFWATILVTISMIFAIVTNGEFITLDIFAESKVIEMFFNLIGTYVPNI